MVSVQSTARDTSRVALKKLMARAVLNHGDMDERKCWQATKELKSANRFLPADLLRLLFSRGAPMVSEENMFDPRGHVTILFFEKSISSQIHI